MGMTINREAQRLLSSGFGCGVIMHPGYSFWSFFMFARIGEANHLDNLSI